MPVTSTLTGGVQLLSGVNTVTGAHGHQTMALTAAETKKRWGGRLAELARLQPTNPAPFLSLDWIINQFKHQLRD